MSDETRRANRLIHEVSPYLLQHAHNPVDWYPWGPEALELARREDRLILLSIGYSACHWCHVMERECFDDQEVAEALSGYVAIKVDREERPDLDELYMTTAMLMAGSAGWPLNIFLTPDQRPFFAGTYFPKHPRQGSPGFLALLGELRSRYGLNPAEFNLVAREVFEALERTQVFRPEEPTLQHSESGYRQVVRLYDPARGGFGPAPKFPQAMVLSYLLAYRRRTGDKLALEVAEKTLEAMANGGIHDQLGGGFHRYAVDERWLVPHFEKMLYDQAMLAQVYLDAWRLTGNERYLTVTRDTLDFVLRELTAPEGGFYSSQDADVEGEEGKFWTWGLSEVERLLGPEEAEAVITYCDITAAGNFEGKSVLHTPRTPEQTARYLRLELDEFLARLARGRAKLFAAREGRTRPGTDHKIVAAWNGLMIETLAEAYKETGEERYLAAAEAAGALALEALRPGGKLKHLYIKGQARIEAFADDFALLAAGLLALHGAGSLKGPWLEAARELTDELLERFWEPEAGGLLYVPREGHGLLLAIHKPADSPTPNASAWAARVLLRLARELNEPTRRDRAATTLAPLVGPASQHSLYMAATLLALEELLQPATG
jgi:hypothetical protein